MERGNEQTLLCTADSENRIVFLIRCAHKNRLTGRENQPSQDQRPLWLFYKISRNGFDSPRPSTKIKEKDLFRVLFLF